MSKKAKRHFRNYRKSPDVYKDNNRYLDIPWEDPLHKYWLEYTGELSTLPKVLRHSEDEYWIYDVTCGELSLWLGADGYIMAGFDSVDIDRTRIVKKRSYIRDVLGLVKEFKNLMARTPDSFKAKLHCTVSPSDIAYASRVKLYERLGFELVTDELMEFKS
jgi:hypothetical protein